MKFIWEVDDIEVGRIVISCTDLKPEQLQTKLYKIGYSYLRDKGTQYCLISMTDGLVHKFVTKEQFVKDLNYDRMQPCPNDLFLEIMESQRTQNEGWHNA